MSASSPDVKSIFGRALEIESPAERSAFVREACAADPSLRAEVEDLLSAMEGAGDFMKRPAQTDSVTIGHAPILEGPGTRIGPYRLLQQIGEGGMGVVYMAEQELPVRRKVALKIIKPGMDSAQVVARFEAERQALAVMDHTNIARVFDGGATETGRPFFVMELVHGIPITQYCDDNQLTPRDRLELFMPVCLAIQHAHQKGIIHRDIKPSNVLVTMYDDKPVPKVIDFGVAKAIEQRLTDRTLFTQFGALVGTFEYMSPEQAEMNAFGVDTRSDIYSLGVLLYELLTGTTPLEKQRLRQAALGEMVRLIKEEEPPRPSVRLSSSGDLPRIAAARKTEPARLSKLVRGEVDWIVMKCLEKDRTRRYETASGLAKDVERYLRDEPVEACPPSAGYRLRKFARKRRTPIAVAAAFALLLVADVIFSTWQAARARRAELRALAASDRAHMAQRDAMSQRDLATIERKAAESSRESLRRSLYTSDMQLAEEAWESGDIVRMSELLDSHKPRTGEDDLRGFEWHYLRRLLSTVQVTKLAGDTLLGQLSPDGTHFVYAAPIAAPEGSEASSSFELRLFEVAAGGQMRRIEPFPDQTVVTHLLSYPFSPDSKRFVFTARIRDDSGRQSWRANVFDWDSGHEVFKLANLGDAPHAFAFDFPGRRMAVVTRERGSPAKTDLKIWDLAGDKVALAIPLQDPQKLDLFRLVFSPDGAHLAALAKAAGLDPARSEGEVRVWDAGTGKELLRFQTRPGSPGSMYSRDGKRLLEIGGAGASHWLRDARSGKEVLELTSGPSAGMSYGAAFSPDGSCVAVTSSDSKVRIWDLTDERTRGRRAPERILEGKISMSMQLAWSADGRRISAAGYGGTVMTWQVASREPHFVVKGSEGTTDVTGTVAAASPLFAAAFEGSDSKTLLKVWDQAGRILFTKVDAPSNHAVTVSRSSKVELSRDGARLAYSCRALTLPLGKPKEVPRLRVWEIASGRELFRRDEEQGSFLHTIFSPDGRRLATTSAEMHGPITERNHKVWIWDLETGRELLRLDVPNVAALAFSPDGRRLAGRVSAASNPDELGELRVWDTATGDTVLTRKFARSRIFGDVAYSDDGKLLAMDVGDVGGAGVIKVLDADTGKERLSLSGHSYEIWKLVFSPDGRRLASFASFPTRTYEVKLWDLVGGREIMTLETTALDLIGSDNPAYGGFAFSPDGHRLSYIQGGSRQDAEVQVWDATPLPGEAAEPSPRR